MRTMSACCFSVSLKLSEEFIGGVPATLSDYQGSSA
jgi:hypothetical protein